MLSDFIRYLFLRRTYELFSNIMCTEQVFLYAELLENEDEEVCIKGAYRESFYQSRFPADYRYFQYMYLQKLVDIGVLTRSCYYRGCMENKIYRPKIKDFYVIESTDADTLENFNDEDLFMKALINEAGVDFYLYWFNESDGKETSDERISNCVEELLKEYPQLLRVKDIREMLHEIYESYYIGDEGGYFILCDLDKCRSGDEIAKFLISNLVFLEPGCINISGRFLMCYIPEIVEYAEGLDISFSSNHYSLSIIVAAIMLFMKYRICKVRLPEQVKI